MRPTRALGRTCQDQHTKGGTLLQLVASVAVCIVLFAGGAAGQTATVTRNVHLRPDSSTEKPSIRLLTPPTQLRLVNPEPEDGFFSVRTTEGQEGWVWGKNVRIEEGFSPAAAAIASVISPTWTKPPAKGGTFTGTNGPCPWAGVGDEEGSNRLKNRTDIPSSYRDVSFEAIADLPMPQGPKARSKWSGELRKEFEAFEGIPVRVVGFLVAVKPQSGSAEATNCRFTKAAETDWHMALVANAGDGEHDAIVVETTPRIRKNHPKWTKGRLGPWTDTNQPVRISGFLFFDTEHRNHLGKYRSTLWEVHPITRIEVLEAGRWVSLDEIQ